jgi:actin-related protein 5
MDLDQDITFLPALSLPAVPHNDSYDDHRGQFTPLIIDNGATTLRFGFATSASPHTGTNVIAKYKERRTNRPLLLFADGVDAESGAKGQARTPWEGDVLLNFDALVRFRICLRTIVTVYDHTACS